MTTRDAKRPVLGPRGLRVVLGAALLAGVAWLCVRAFAPEPSITETPAHSGAVPAGDARSAADADFPADAVAWAPSLTAALHTARASDRLVLVYVALPPGRCPACELLHRDVLSKPEAAELSRRYVAARVRLDDDPDPAAGAMLARLGVQWAPTFLALSGTGDLVHRGFGPRLPVMGVEGRAVFGSHDAGTVARLLDGMRNAEAIERRDQASLQMLSGRKDPGSLLALAEVFDRRGRLDEAVGAYRLLERLDPGSRVAERLVELFLRFGDVPAARREMERWRADHPGDPRRLDFELRALLLEHGMDAEDSPIERDRVAAFADALAVRVAEAREAGSVGAEGRARLVRARLLAEGGDEAAAADALAWFAEHEDDHAWDAPTRMAVAMLAMGRRDMRLAIRHLETILREFPDTVQADTAKHGFLDGLRSTVAEQQRAAPSGPSGGKSGSGIAVPEPVPGR